MPFPAARLEVPIAKLHPDPIEPRFGSCQSDPNCCQALCPDLASVLPFTWREKGEARGWLAAYAAGKLMLPSRDHIAGGVQ